MALRTTWKLLLVIQVCKKNYDVESTHSKRIKEISAFLKRIVSVQIKIDLYPDIYY